MKRWFALPLICVAASASAQVPATSWHEVVLGLQAQGIQPASVPWLSVNQACMAYYEDDQRFAACQLETASLTVLHKRDAEACEQLGEARALAYSKPQGWGQRYIYHTRLSKRDQKKLFRAALLECMTERGWADAENPLMGTR